MLAAVSMMIFAPSLPNYFQTVLIQAVVHQLLPNSESIAHVHSKSDLVVSRSSTLCWNCQTLQPQLPPSWPQVTLISQSKPKIHLENSLVSELSSQSNQANQENKFSISEFLKETEFFLINRYSN